MGSEINFKDSNAGSRIKLNTKEFCFLCLNRAQNGEQDEIYSVINRLIHQPVSLLCLVRYLKNDKSSEPTLPQEQVEVNLCNDCEKVIKRFTVLFQELEKIQMEMDFCLEKIHLRISNGAQDTELVQYYSQRMTSDLESLSQLARIDKFRKEISKQGLNNRRNPTVAIQRVLFEDLPTSPRSLLVEQNLSEVEIDFSIPPSPCPSSSHLPYTIEAVDDSNSETQEDSEIEPAEKLLNEVDPNTELLKNSEEEPKRSQSQGGKVFLRDPLTGRVPCPSCEKTFADSNGARFHYEAVHLKKRWKCDICNASVFSRYDSLISHKKTCRQNLQKRAAEEQFRSHYKFPCPVCGKRFSALFELRKHQKLVHAESRKFSCDHCNKTFKSAGYLKDHIEGVHLNKTWSCKYCNKVFTYHSSCTRHQKKCLLKNSIKLEEDTSQSCRRNFPKDFKTGKVLCPVCNQGFAKAQAAHRHYDKIHLQKKYKCDVCNVAEYNSRSGLCDHKKVCRQVSSQQPLNSEQPLLFFIVQS